MVDREKVIKGLTVHLSNKVPPCDECPYANCEDMRRYNDPSSCSLSMVADALVLLKEQESVIEALKSDLSETLAVLGEQAELVRCKECTHAEQERVEDEVWCPVTCSLRRMDWFCADGERAENARSSSEIPNS